MGKITGGGFALLFVLLLIFAQVGMETVDARTCESQSHKHKGACVSDTNCANICRSERFPGGHCRTHIFSRRCYCVKPCP